jgi:excisionase family DNA binding protein
MPLGLPHYSCLLHHYWSIAVDTEKALLTVPEAAKRLSLGRATAYQLARCGALPVVRIGRAIRIPAKALEAWVESQTTGGEIETIDQSRLWS